MRLAICDDDAMERSALVALAERFMAHSPLEWDCVVFCSGCELVSALERGEAFDIYFLDILMPHFSGLETAKEIRAVDKNAQILFLTSSSEFALESYSVKANTYLLKPITWERLCAALTDALEQIEQTQGAAIVIKSAEGIQRVLLSNLVYVEAMGKRVAYHVVSGRVVLCAGQFAAVCDKLAASARFIKPHRSYLVNMSYIDTIGSAEIQLQTKAAVPIAQGRAKEIRDRYLAFQMEG